MAFGSVSSWVFLLLIAFIFLPSAFRLLIRCYRRFKPLRGRQLDFLREFLIARPRDYDFLRYIQKDVNENYLLEGLAYSGNHIWRQLQIDSGTTLFELGPGHGFLTIKAALNGVHVVVLEHPKSHYLPFFKANIDRFGKAIAIAGGSIELIEGDVLDESIRATVLKRFGSHSCLNVVALDVLRPNPHEDLNQVQSIIKRHESRWGTGTGLPKFGIWEPSQVDSVIRFLIALKDPRGGCFFLNHTVSLERTRESVQAGVLRAEWPFVEVEALKEQLASSDVMKIISTTRCPTLRTPLEAGVIYRIGKVDTLL